jgi:hypothetical protein
MVPSSEAIEALLTRAKEAAAALRKLKGAEVTRVELKTELASLGKEWLKISQSLRSASVVDGAKLGEFDSTMQDLASSASTRARASALLKKLEPFVDGLFSDVVVPLIQYEGSPRQVAGRQVQSAFTGQTTPDEATYIEEAARRNLSTRTRQRWFEFSEPPGRRLTLASVGWSRRRSAVAAVPADRR